MTARPVLLALAVLVSAKAWAIEGGSVADDFSYSGAARDPNNPRTGSITDTLSGSLEVTEALAFDLAIGLTASTPTKAVAGESFGSRGGLVYTVAPAVDWDPTEQLSFSLSGFVSPKSTLVSDSTLSYSGPRGATVNADVALKSITSSQGATLMAGFDTAGDSRFDAALSVSGGFAHFATQQSIAEVRGPEGNPVSPATLLTFCDNHPCSKQMEALLKSSPAVSTLWQFPLNASVIATLFHDTDVGLSFTWFFYDRDPTEVGFFSLASIGRGETSFGEGVPLAPVLFNLRPEVSHRFGDFSLRVWYQRSQYVGDEGHGDTLGIKAQYKITRAWRVTLTLSGDSDKDAAGNASKSGTIAAGVKLRF